MTSLLRAFWPAPIAAGALMWMSFPPLDQGWLMPLAWALLFTSMRLRRGAKAGRQAFLAALVLFVPGLSWIRPLVWPLWLVVALWCAAWEGIFGWGVGRVFARTGRPRPAWVVAAPAAHLLVDMLRTVVLTGFPWLLAGYSGWQNPVLIGSADLLGVHGATLAILALAAGLAELVARRVEDGVLAWRALAPAAALWTALAAWAFGKPAPEETRGPTVLLLQPNIHQLLKEDAIREGRPQAGTEVFWSAHEELAAKGIEEAKARGLGVDVVVWAETMVPAAANRPLVAGEPLATWVHEQDGQWRVVSAAGRRVAAAARGGETLAGIATVQTRPEGLAPLEYNTVVALDAEGRVLGFQDKQHLTPGGEYIPLAWLIPSRERFEAYLREMAGFLPNVQPGESANVLPLRGGARAGVMICYESVFPEIAREMVRRGATLLVSCSNYGWFAGTSEMDQALAICVFRAAELRRTFVASSNNGVSAVIGCDGRVRAATGPDEKAYLLAGAPLCASQSPFAVIGEWGAWVLGALGASGIVWIAKSQPTPPA